MIASEDQLGQMSAILMPHLHCQTRYRPQPIIRYLLHLSVVENVVVAGGHQKWLPCLTMHSARGHDDVPRLTLVPLQSSYPSHLTTQQLPTAPLLLSQTPEHN